VENSYFVNLAVSLPMLSKQLVLKSSITTGSFDDFVENILQLGASRSSAYVCCANVHMVVEAHRDASFQQTLAEATMVTPDGGPVASIAGWLSGRKQERVAGMDLVPALLKEAAQRGQSVYFYGTTDDVLTAITNRIKRDLPTLRVAGTCAPPFRALTETEENEHIAAINTADPDLLFVALGCPRQERWMAAHQGKIKACMLGVGQAFLVYGELEQRLPVWARRLWLEWAYRLWLEPRRLWRRYLITNSRFLYLMARQVVVGNR
jgi:N-acetylglucosaminyldiphosphoundecaprenol N-acetyl-beta-D-mannosaminyltransferase